MLVLTFRVLQILVKVENVITKFLLNNFITSNSTIHSMAPDIRNVNRGRCQSCESCNNFISLSGLILCDYCGCPPARHLRLPTEQPSNVGLQSLDVRSNVVLRSNISDGNLAEVSDIPSSKSDCESPKNNLEGVVEQARGREATG